MNLQTRYELEVAQDELASKSSATCNHAKRQVLAGKTLLEKFGSLWILCASDPPPALTLSRFGTN